MLRRLFKLAVYLILLAALAAGALAALGMAMPPGHQATRSAYVPASPDAIFNTIISPREYPEWRPDVKSVELANDDRFTEIYESDSLTFQITERTHFTRVVIAVDDPDVPFTGTWTYELTAAHSGGTQVRITEQGTVSNPLFRAINRIFMSQTDSMETWLRNLGRRFGTEVRIEP